MNLEDRDKLLKTIRCILIPCKNGLYTHQLCKDYKEMEGKPIPFRQFGFNDVESFLRSSNSFILATTAQGTVVMAKSTEDSKHITDLVQSQARGKKKKSMPPRMAIRSQSMRSSASSSNIRVSRPRTNNSNRMLFGYRSTNYNQRTINIAQNYSSQPTLNQPNGNFPQPNITRTINNENYNGNGNNLWENLPANPTIDPKKNIKVHPAELMRETFQTAQPIQSKSSTLQPFNRHDDRNNFDERLSTNPKSDANKDAGYHSTEPLLKTFKSVAPPQPEPKKRIAKKVNESKVSHSFIQKMLKMSLGPQKTASVQSRLIIQKSLESEKELDMLAADEPDTIVPIEQIEQSEAINFDELNEMDPIEAIVAYCSKMNIAQPEYEDYYVQKSKKYIMKVTIDDKPYSTYPDEFSTLFEAKKCAARKAFIEIRQFTEGDKLSVCTDSSEQIATKIFDIIDDNGRFFDSIPLAFQEEYNCSLPRHWEQIVYKKTDLFLLERNDLKKVIIYPKRSKLYEITIQNKQNEIPLLRLPWNKKYWHIFVTQVKSTNEVWGCLHGPEYWDKLTALKAKSEKSLPTQPAKTIEVGGYYMALPGRFRVHILEVDHSKNIAVGQIIDEMNICHFSFDDLYEMDSALKTIPGQAVQFSLRDLSDFSEISQINSEAEKHLVTKDFFAEITSNEFKLPVEVVLFDKLENNRININELILTKASEQFGTPTLNPRELNLVKITHVNEFGQIYCSVHGSIAMQCIERMIAKTVHNIRDTEACDGFIAQGELYLVCDKATNKWYRGLISIGGRTFMNLENPFFCVDYGLTCKTNRIYSLKSLCPALMKFPHQAKNVRLADSKSGSTEYWSCIQKILQPNETVYLQVVDPQQTMRVNIWKRIGSKIVDVVQCAELSCSGIDKKLPDDDDSFSSSVRN